MLPRRLIKVARSRDLVHWETHPVGAQLCAPDRPACWTPDVQCIRPDPWTLYGSLKFDDHEDAGLKGHGIFVARSGGPTGFADPAILKRGPGFTTIDPTTPRAGPVVRRWA